MKRRCTVVSRVLSLGLPLALLLAASCKVPQAPKAAPIPADWAGTFKSESDCFDGDVSLSLNMGSEVTGEYVFVGTEAQSRGHRAVYAVRGTADGSHLSLGQERTGGDTLPSGSVWCQGQMELDYKPADSAGGGGVIPRFKRLLSGRSGMAEQLVGTWIAEDCGCAGTMVFGPASSH